MLPRSLVVLSGVLVAGAATSAIVAWAYDTFSCPRKCGRISDSCVNMCRPECSAQCSVLHSSQEGYRSCRDSCLAFCSEDCHEQGGRCMQACR